MPNLWLNVKNRPEENEEPGSRIPYDEIPLWDFLITRIRLFVIENRDVISVALILIMGFAVLWTVRTGSQPVSTRSEAAGVTPTPVVTILVVTPTPSVSPTISPIPTLPLQPVLTSTPSIIPTGPRPTNPFWEYLK